MSGNATLSQVAQQANQSAQQLAQQNAHLQAQMNFEWYLLITVLVFITMLFLVTESRSSKRLSRSTLVNSTRGFVSSQLPVGETFAAPEPDPVPVTKVACEYCGTPNNFRNGHCQSCGAPEPLNAPEPDDGKPKVKVDFSTIGCGR